jgi:hypothetical protein
MVHINKRMNGQLNIIMYVVLPNNKKDKMYAREQARTLPKNHEHLTVLNGSNQSINAPPVVRLV